MAVISLFNSIRTNRLEFLYLSANPPIGALTLTNRFPAIHLGAPGEDISKKDLHAVAQRFKYFNQLRLQRVQSFLQPRQQDFLKLLPLLFHQNHPLLPGFVSLDVPAGIPDYLPIKPTLDVAKQFSKGFVYKRKALKNYPIQAIFLMGSVGSMAFSKESDIDIWLCHASSMAAEQLAELKQKAEEIEKWAASLKVEVHFFLVDAQQFLSGENTPISKESSGETQHFLLLEEFYRTSIYIAGRIPVWWLVPPEQEGNYHQYVAHLLENRFISDAEVLDFGGLERVPMAEFVSATLWHIYKSLTSPHKSLLKLLLMESYASSFPNPKWLSLILKQAIYQGHFSVDRLDPYLLAYSQVDDYLCQADYVQRLNLIRECLYMKIMGAAENAPENRIRVLREEFMRMVATQWQWPNDLLGNLATLKFWDIKKATVEHAVIRDQLQQCLRMILKFAGVPLEQAQRENRDLMLIGRKLRAMLDLRPGKIEILTTRTTVNYKPDLLVIIEAVSADEISVVWRLYVDRVTPQQATAERAIMQGDSLLEVLCWAVVNGLYKKSLNLQLISKSLKLSANDLSQLFNELNLFLTRYLLAKDIEMEVYAYANQLLSSVLLINLGESLAIDINNPQLVMSARSDPLSYGDNRLCFIQSIQRLSASSWGEAVLQTYTGLEGVFSCITDTFNHCRRPLTIERLQVLCYTSVRGKSIVLRLEALFAKLVKYATLGTADVQRYVVASGSGYCVFQLKDKQLSYYLLDSNNQLLQELARPYPQFSPIFFDDFVLEQTYIPCLYAQNQLDVIQVFYHASSKHVAVYIIDEKGALFVHQHNSASPEQVLVHYSVFFDSLINGGQLSSALRFKCYEIQRNSAGVISCHPVQVRLGETAMDLRIKIDAEKNARTLVYCNDQRFEINDANSVHQVRQFILNFRRNREEYPYHITEIAATCLIGDMESHGQLQSIHYLNFKRKIEARLNV